MPVRAVGIALCAVAITAAGARADVVRTTADSEVYPRPARSRHSRGQVAKGARFQVLERKRAGGCKGEWLRIGERAWLCSAATQPTSEAAGGPLGPEVPAGRSLPGTYVVTFDAPVYASLEAAAAGTTRRKLWGTGGYRFAGDGFINGKRYLRAGGGWVAASDARVVDDIPFRGVELPADAAGKRLAFVGPRPVQPVDAGGRALAMGPLPAQSWLGEVGAPVGPRALIPIGGERFLPAAEVRLLHFAAPLAGLAAGEHWVDVDLTQQTLVAYQGTRPVYATLVSTANTTTPVGVFRVQKKRPHARMTSRPHYRRKWDTDAPWVITIRERIAIHTAYWHTEYGTPRSMGCVNLSPADARWLWQFTSPALPPGWLRIEVDGQDQPTRVRIRRSPVAERRARLRES